MKSVTGYRCEYCGRFRVKAETMEKHEKECLNNPNCVNCYMCKHAVEGGYTYDPYNGERYAPNMPYCSHHQESLSTLRSQGLTADNCTNYEKASNTYHHRWYDSENDEVTEEIPLEVLGNKH